ncbi:MAG: HAD-IA family hydrolase, partial [Oscillospiraceae bacterium]
LNLSGTENSCANREKLCKALNVPSKLSKKAFLQVLNRMCTRKEIEDILAEKGEDKPNPTENHCCGDEDILAENGEVKPVLFWDFHGTLTIPDNQWIDGALKAYDENFSYLNISHEKIIENLSGKCLPWWTYPQRDTRHLIKDDGWWRSCEREFVNMYMACGLSREQAETISPLIRRYVIDSQNHRLHSDVLFVLQELKSRGYKSYILSNNFPELPQLLSALNLSQFFEDTVVSGLVGYDKPRKEIFEFAKTIANRPEKCIMIGDNPTDDIKGAKACGFATILVNDRHPDYSGEDADFICKTLKDILAVLK